MRSLLIVLLLSASFALRPGIALAAGQVWSASGGGGMRLGYTPLHFPTSYNVPWSVELSGSCIGDSSPVVDQYHRIYLATNDDRPGMTQSYLYCLGSDGSLVWKVPIGARLEFQPVLLASGTVLVISDLKQLFAFNPDGTLFWKLQLTASPAPIDSSLNGNYSANLRQPAHIQPVPDSAGGFYVVDDTPAVISLDGAGRRRWSATFVNTPLGGLTMGSGTLYLPTSDGWLHIYSSVTGADLGPISISGSAAYYGTFMPGSFLYYPVLATNGPHAVGLSIAKLQPFDYQLNLNPTTPISVDAAGTAVVGIGAAGSVDKTVMTDGQVVGLDKAGNAIWSRDFSAVPTGVVLTDASGLLCFGTQGIGQSGVYCFHPSRGVQWWTLTQGATSVFPIDDYLLGATLFYDREFNRTTLRAIGGKK